MNEYATQTDKEALRERCWEAYHGPEYRTLCAMKELVKTNNFTTLQEDVVLSAIECAMEELQEVRV